MVVAEYSTEALAALNKTHERLLLECSMIAW
jgi:hypothetical protein